MQYNMSKIHLASRIRNNKNNLIDEDPLQTFSKTCSVIYGKINRKQFEYMQAITSLQESMLSSCNGLVGNQVDLIEQYSKKGIMTKQQIVPVIKGANKMVESYLNYLSLEYDLTVARIRLHHKILTLINDSSPKLTQLYMDWLNSFKIEAK
jgi:hypothetical protein